MAIRLPSRSSILPLMGRGGLAFTLPSIACPQGQDYRSFRKWCMNLNQLSGTTRNLVETLLLKMETKQCDLAHDRLQLVQYLNLDATPLSDPNPVTTGPISDLRPLSSLTNLKGLNLYHQPLTGLKPLSALVNLTYLDLRGTGVTDITPLAPLKNLQTLDLRENAITSWQPLKALPRLQQLFLGDCDRDR